jgi:hypothetical protein
MPDTSSKSEAAPLNRTERSVAAIAGLVLFAVALAIVIAPPQRRVALSQCQDAAAGCIVSVDSDLTTFASVLVAAGAAAVLLALLGIRFNRVKVAGTELTYDQATEGLARAAPATAGEVDPSVPAVKENLEDVPVKVELRKGLGEILHAVPIAVTELTRPMREVDPSFLRDYQSARKISQHSHFLTHILGPATKPGQKYSVAIRVTPHRDATRQVKSATFYLGRSWGNSVFEGMRGPDGRFGIATEAYGPFLALCEVEFDNGNRILLDHYCDFDMGSLLPT